METLRSRPQHSAARTAWVSACVALCLSACVKQVPEVTSPAADAESASGELNWARAALQRNPALEVVATDASAGVFTVRDKASGEVRAVKLDELAAVPVATLSASTPPTTAPSEASPPAPEIEPAREADTSSTSTTEMAAAEPAATPNYTIERADGQIKVSGPGISIVSSGTPTVTPAAGAAGQRGAEPIICEGRRMLHLDNRNIFVDGNAITARGGCELYITNSRVSASGTGVIVEDAVVHIANSTIEGNAASFDARDNARVYMRSSTFDGLPRRAEQAVVQDQGGNQWR